MALGEFLLRNRRNFIVSLKIARLFLVVAMLAVGFMEMFSVLSQPGAQIGVAALAGLAAATLAKISHIV
ncbi:hypothetical protein [Brucella tritici]|uniref:hypothetical protein n=1 Tax=Brucella tritici TaxID=94626 RepID=UPI001591D4A0|nr:hypothetical protein [Brucella tritici]